MAREYDNPIQLFSEWYEDAVEKEPGLPDAVSLATVGEDMMPQVRMVLLKGFGDDGFVFYTNLESRKAQQIEHNNKAALCFYWKSLRKQVRVEGPAEQVTDEEADAYFATRAKESQIGAWASRQSREMDFRFELERRFTQYGLKYAVGSVPRPDFWSGYRVIPERMEFWEERPFRLHKRTEYWKKEDGSWQMHFLFP